MANYSNSNVVQCMRQYDMFSNSLSLVKSHDEKSMIVKQLTKLENKIIELTNESYEEEYYALANKECDLLDEEKKRINMLVELINQRLSYVEKRCNNHYQLTGESIDANNVLGANTLDTLENKVRIIDKYSKNIKMREELSVEVKSLSSKIELASEKIEINKNLNEELEIKFKELLSSAFEKYDLYDLLDSREEIEYAYYETEKSLTLAELNLEYAKTSPINVLSDCQQMMKEIKEDYVKYKDKLSLLKLMEIFNKDVADYDSLLEKRKEVNEILKCIKHEDFLKMVMEPLTKQYNTIIMEQQDINTYNDLTIEKERKMEALSDIEKENNSEEFQTVLKVLIENEEKHQQELLEEKKKLEEAEKKRKLELEKKRQEEILKRQKIIEEARKKEIEKRTKKLLEQQQNSVLSNKKKDEDLGFSAIKEKTTVDSIIETNKSYDDEIENKVEKDIEEETVDSLIEEENVPILKNKVDIENELFEEFNNNRDNKSFIDNDDNKLPNVSLDEYMKNFDVNSIKKTSSIFDEDDDDGVFPSIPL